MEAATRSCIYYFQNTTRECWCSAWFLAHAKQVCLAIWHECGQVGGMPGISYPI